ncbi:MAG: DUF4230 domain-containing protein [Deinococcales bacterium]|nr:DUF4230 domain-containing protein [Chitinophagaceae bacterium]
MTYALKLSIRLMVFILLLLLVYFVGRWVFGSNKPPEPVITHNAVLQSVTAMGKLELVKYQFKDVVEYQSEQTGNNTLNKLLPKAKAVLIVSGEAIGCIDLTKITVDDIVTNMDTMVINLPAPELCLYKIDHQKSKVYDVRNGYFVEEGKMVSDAYAAAEIQLKKLAMEMGILGQTNTNAVKILTPILEKIANKKIILKQH